MPLVMQIPKDHHTPTLIGGLFGAPTTKPSTSTTRLKSRKHLSQRRSHPSGLCDNETISKLPSAFQFDALNGDVNFEMTWQPEANTVGEAARMRSHIQLRAEHSTKAALSLILAR
jgi:hypothetical protein